MAASRVDVTSGDEEPVLVADINITPLVDVVLVLLIIFMVGSSAMVDAARQGTSAEKERIDLQLPSASESHSVSPDAPVMVLGLDKNGRQFVDGEPVTQSALSTLLRATRDKAPETAIVIDADGTVPHRQVVELLDAAQTAGFRNVGIGTEASAGRP